MSTYRLDGKMILKIEKTEIGTHSTYFGKSSDNVLLKRLLKEEGAQLENGLKELAEAALAKSEENKRLAQEAAAKANEPKPETTEAAE